MKIVLCYPVEKRHYDQICETAGSDVEVIDAGQERIAEEIFNADIYCGHAKVPVDWEGVVKQGRLKWIQSSAAGMDHCLVPPVIHSDIVVCSASGVLAEQVGEHTIALLTAWTRSLSVFFRAQEKREFIRRPTRDLTETTVGIVGFGGNGRRLAQMLTAFDCRILATDMFPVDKPDYVDELWPADRLEEMLSQVDFLVLGIPLNDATRGMFNAPMFAKMKPGSVFANMARGGIVVHDALVETLRSGHLGGAVLDVTDPEPLPVESPLWAMPQVIITPHVGGQCVRRIDNMTHLFCENLRRRRDRRPLINRLTDLNLGFPVRGGDVPIWQGVKSLAPADSGLDSPG